MTRDPLTDPRAGDVVQKGKVIRQVARSHAGNIHYTSNTKSTPSVCWITTWCDWCKKATVIKTAEEQTP